LRAGVDNAWSRKGFFVLEEGCCTGLSYHQGWDLVDGVISCRRHTCWEDISVSLSLRRRKSGWTRRRVSFKKRRERALDTVRETGPLLTCNRFQLKSSCSSVLCSTPHFPDTNMGSCWPGAYWRRGCPRAGLPSLVACNPTRNGAVSAWRQDEQAGRQAGRFLSVIDDWSCPCLVPS
jgi:hypothetical protein